MPKTLLHCLEGLRADTPLLLCQQGTLTIKDFIPATLAWRSTIGARCAGRRVLLSVAQPVQLALAMAALDGFAATIALAPATLNQAGLAAFAEVARAEIFMGSEPCPVGLIHVELPQVSQVVSDGVCTPSLVPTSWLLATSGTTGRPKLYAHTFASLTAAARGPSTRSGEFCWGLLYDPHRFAGLQVLLQSMIAGSPLCVTDSLSDLVPMVTTFRKHGVNSLSATPSLWRRLLMVPGFSDLNLKQITLGGEIADQGILDTLKYTFPQSRIVHIYACTEAGVAFSVKDGLEGFPSSFLVQPPSEVEIKVDADSVLHLRPAGYRPERIDSEDIASADGFIRTGDRVHITDGRVRFLGRETGLINVGGLKVQPEEVERVLLSHPAVAMARVQGRRSSIAGQLVEAEIGLRPDHSATPALTAALRAHCMAQLPAYKVPAMIRVVSDLRLSTTGKLERTSQS